MGGKEIWNAWDPDCFIARLSEPLYSSVLLGLAISHRLEGVASQLCIKNHHSIQNPLSFWLKGRRHRFFHRISCIGLSDNATRVSPGNGLDGAALHSNAEDLRSHLAMIYHSDSNNGLQH